MYADINNYHYNKEQRGMDMKKAGDGVNLYFKILKWLLGIFTCLFMIASPALTIYFSGEA
jgi:hypothetical protein